MKKQLQWIMACALLCAGLDASAQWTTPLPIPGTLTGMPMGNYMVYNLSMDSTKHQFFPGGDSIPTYSFNNSGYLGPTIIWTKGDSVEMNVTNNLDQPSTLHWHGAHVPPHADGGPHDSIAAGTTWSPMFKIMDDATTMWYHPHLHEETMMQVQKGLAGMIIIRDPNDPFQSQLPTTYGTDDIPLIFQDKQFIAGSTPGDSIIETTCSMGPHLLVNGAPEPVLHVPAQMVRFRMLNGASERVFNLGYNDNTTFNIIATDAGYTAAPIPLDSNMMLATGERVEWITDFSSRQGDTLYLVNNGTRMGSDIPGSILGDPGCYQVTHIDSINPPLMRIIVDAPTVSPVTSIPSAFNPLAIPDTSLTARYRTKHFNLYNTNPNATPFSIDSLPYDMELINDTVTLGDIEVWTLINQSQCCAHPFHIHDIHFFILDINGNPVLPPNMQGPKDVVLVGLNDTVRFVTQFTDFSTAIDPMDTYMYHCHILSHEDGGMMHQFVVTDPNATVSVQESKAGESWKLYPNPASSSFMIEGDCSSSSLIRLYDSKGALGKEISIPPFKGKRTIDIEGLAPGLWLVQWQTPGAVKAHRLVIE